MSGNEDSIGHSAAYWRLSALKAREALAEIIALNEAMQERIEAMEAELAKLKAQNSEAQNA